jgi:hypothetical protein
MAATVVSKKVLANAPFVQIQVKYSGLTAGLSETVALSGLIPEGVTPDTVTCMTTTTPTSNDPVFFAWTSTSTSADTITVKFDTVAGGDLAGAYVTVHIVCLNQASDGLTAP